MTELASSSIDHSGRERLTWNVLVSWLSQLITVGIGFIMPRLIHDNLGQVTLGVWDFGWAIVSYLSLVNFGIGSNSSKFVAQYRPNGQTRRLCEVMSTAHLMQLAICTAVFIGVYAIYANVGTIFSSEAVDVEETGLVLLLLGYSLGVQMLTDAYRGIITGCHRWDVHNGVNTFHNISSAVGMITTLLLGLGIQWLALVYFVSTVAAEILRFMMSRRVCPEVEIRIQFVNKEDARRILSFGLKTLATLAGSLSVQQTVSILITVHLGPAALAVFARPAALMRHIENFISKFSFILMPTTSSMHGMGRKEELQEFALQMSKVGWALALPAGVFMVVFGPELIGLWMGEEYVNAPLLWILAIGGCLASANRVGYRILSGMDIHGAVSFQGLMIYLMTLCLGIAWMTLWNGGLLAAACIFVLGEILFNAVLVPIHMARMLGISVVQYLWRAGHRAVLIGVVSFLFLEGLKTVETFSVMFNILAGGLCHGVLVSILYWRFVLTDPLKVKIRSVLPFARRD